jgi:hypothetical protein
MHGVCVARHRRSWPTARRFQSSAYQAAGATTTLSVAVEGYDDDDPSGAALGGRGVTPLSPSCAP